ncbi:DNA-directed RNA polymerase subunit beta, partial [bacterium]|nr:DNA-directed RNA polymerase subunit beta [bacterium]
FVVALMSLDGYNFEDSIVVSERIVKEGLLDSVHIEKFEAVARRTKLGEEVITADIPNVDAELLANLTEEGVVREGTAVNPGDILVGKLTPKPEKERTPEERLLWKIINQRGSDMRNTSLRMPAGERGVVVRVQSLSKEDANAELRPGVLRKIEVYVAVQRRLTVGDKLAGRHGNKGVISRLMPEEDMPYLADGTPVDVIMNPLGVPSRMNIGQLMELHLGWAGRQAGFRAEVPVFNGPGMGVIEDELAKAGCDITGKSILFDGRTGRQMENDVVVGVMYVMKLIHLAEDKIHARSIGPYSLITQQPLGGRARSGGQRFGEMEVWALEAYGASRALQEMITIKSDDIEGRNNAYKKMIAGEPISLSLKPESINNLDKEIRGLGLYLEFLSLSDRSELLPGGDEEETEGADVPAEAAVADGEGADGAAEAGAEDGEDAEKPADDGDGEASKSEPAATPPAPDPDEPVPDAQTPDETPVTAPVAEATEESS